MPTIGTRPVSLTGPTTANFVVVMEGKEGADTVNITADNYVYTFTRKSTNDSVTIRVKEEIFPERFFELRTKCKLAKMGKCDVKKEEKKAFTLLWEKLKEKLMYKPVDYLFEDVNKS